MSAPKNDSSPAKAAAVSPDPPKGDAKAAVSPKPDQKPPPAKANPPKVPPKTTKQKGLSIEYLKGKKVSCGRDCRWAFRNVNRSSVDQGRFPHCLL